MRTGQVEEENRFRAIRDDTFTIIHNMENEIETGGGDKMNNSMS